MDALRITGGQLDGLYESEVKGIQREFQRMGAEETFARDLAWTVVLESQRAGINPELTVAIIKIEDPRLDPRATSYAGAIGIMQVMPQHAGKWGCGSDLRDVRTNVCTGTRIMAAYLHRQWNAQAMIANREALLNYNGCVRTPGCESYAGNVLDKTDFTHPGDVWAKP